MHMHYKFVNDFRKKRICKYVDVNANCSRRNLKPTGGPDRRLKIVKNLIAFGLIFYFAVCAPEACV